MVKKQIKHKIMNEIREIRFKDKCSIQIEDVFPNPTKEQLRKWNEMGEEQKTFGSHFEDWFRTYHLECIKIIKEEFESDETIKN